MSEEQQPESTTNANQQLQLMSREEFKRFVKDVRENRIFVSAMIPPEQIESVMPMVFMPLALGALSEASPDFIKSIGVVWEYYSEAVPMGINGYPMFMSCRFMHKLDWERAVSAVSALEMSDSALMDEAFDGGG